MTPPRFLLPAAFCLLTQAAYAATATPTPPPQKPRPGAYALELWRDPGFARFFLGTYSVFPDVEPPLKDSDKELLQQILPLMSKPTDAANAVVKLINKDSNAIFDLTLANIYLENDRMAQAELMFNQAVSKFPSFRRAWRGLGMTQVRQQKWLDAVTSLSRAITLGAQDGPSYGLYGFALLSLDRAASAESAYRMALMFQPDVLDWKLGLVRCVLKQQKAAEAASLCEEIIRENPDRTEFLSLQSEAYLAMKDTTKAAENLEILARGGSAKVEDLQRLGDIYLVGKDSALALSAYSRAINTGSFDIAKVLTQAENLSMQNALPEASSLIQQARAAKGKLAPADEARLLKLEARLAVNAGKAGDAVPILQRVVELNPMDGGALMLLGQHYMDAKDDLKATNYFERAGKLGDYEADASLRLAQIQISAGKLTDALPLLKRSNEIKARDSVAKLIADIERAVRKSGSK
jgi:tetratricopeptide (TPR) repeat protein